MHDSNDLIRVMMKFVDLWLYVHTQEAEHAQQKNTSPTNTPLGAEGGAESHGRSQQETFGGYDCEFVKPPQSVFQTECPICSLILRDPYLPKCCGTNFCHTCCERLEAEHKPCPTCRDDNFEVFPNKGLKRSLNQLHVLCPYSKDGCEWIGELGELEHHLSEVAHSGESWRWYSWGGDSWVGEICPVIAMVHVGGGTAVSV